MLLSVGRRCEFDSQELNFFSADYIQSIYFKKSFVSSRSQSKSKHNRTQQQQQQSRNFPKDFNNKKSNHFYFAIVTLSSLLDSGIVYIFSENLE